jgi:hypothetical protein
MTIEKSSPKVNQVELTPREKYINAFNTRISELEAQGVFPPKLVAERRKVISLIGNEVKDPEQSGHFMAEIGMEEFKILRQVFETAKSQMRTSLRESANRFKVEANLLELKKAPPQLIESMRETAFQIEEEIRNFCERIDNDWNSLGENEFDVV